MTRRRPLAAITCEKHGHVLDEYPWEHQNSGRIPAKYGIPGQDKWAPREQYCEDRGCYA